MLIKIASQTFFRSRNELTTQQHGLSIIFFNSGVRYGHQDKMSICSETTQIFRNQLLASKQRKWIMVQDFILTN